MNNEIFLYLKFYLFKYVIMSKVTPEVSTKVIPEVSTKVYVYENDSNDSSSSSNSFNSSYNIEQLKSKTKYLSYL